ncbi:unnamed protein product (macronuclear) [Paramecium tetraurelia]|uniref:Uncharacterized protein n=1 Tax=Paramecium tetraurelia TaxID=5888 RepID=A0BBR4_PARTE|nr:uncharacterized protein GSPATT00000416001 [Paramecium tetraurelia]CAK55981.1 unnamed protein product [Paramecium tetraurelia]|eukprot:XP_001423379.1 hypothetical protein (macronuclear) [Paramecium tetraurelia strain d4-2]
MSFQVYKPCNQTQNKEEYICTNKQCLADHKKQLHCYPCLTKLHRDKKQKISHLDDFMEMSQIMFKVQQKKDQRILFLNQIQQKAIDFQKEKVQYIQKYPFHSTEYLEEVVQKVENEISKFSNFWEVQFYNQENHNVIFDLFHSNENQYNSNTQQKLYELFTNVNKFLQQKDLNVYETLSNQRKKFQVLEEKVMALERPFTINKLLKYTFFILLMVVFSNYFLHPNNSSSNVVLRDESKLIEQIKQTVQEQMTLLQLDTKNQIEEMKHKWFEEIMKDIEYIKLFNQKLKIEIIEFQKSYKDHFYAQSQINNNQKIQIENLEQQIGNQTQMIMNLDMKLQNYSKDKQQSSQKKDINTQDLEAQFQETHKQVKAVDLKFETALEEVKKFVVDKIEINRHYYNAQLELLGRIHTDFPFILLSGFQQYYLKDFSVKFPYETIKSIQQSLSHQAIVCLGGIDMKTPDRFILMACDYAFEVFQETVSKSKARKSRSSDELYWYLVRNHSIGFSPKEMIDLRQTDNYDVDDTRRFSHLLDHPHGGGRRIGNQLTLSYSTDYGFAIFAIN